MLLFGISAWIMCFSFHIIMLFSKHSKPGDAAKSSSYYLPSCDSHTRSKSPWYFSRIMKSHIRAAKLSTQNTKQLWHWQGFRSWYHIRAVFLALLPVLQTITVPLAPRDSSPLFNHHQSSKPPHSMSLLRLHQPSWRSLL